MFNTIQGNSPRGDSGPCCPEHLGAQMQALMAGSGAELGAGDRDKVSLVKSDLGKVAKSILAALRPGATELPQEESTTALENGTILSSRSFLAERIFWWIDDIGGAGHPCALRIECRWNNEDSSRWDLFEVHKYSGIEIVRGDKAIAQFDSEYDRFLEHQAERGVNTLTRLRELRSEELEQFRDQNGEQFRMKLTPESQDTSFTLWEHPAIEVHTLGSHGSYLWYNCDLDPAGFPNLKHISLSWPELEHPFESSPRSEDLRWKNFHVSQDEQGKEIMVSCAEYARIEAKRSPRESDLRFAQDFVSELERFSNRLQYQFS